jgi:hypothetical protein
VPTRGKATEQPPAIETNPSNPAHRRCLHHCHRRFGQENPHARIPAATRRSHATERTGALLTARFMTTPIRGARAGSDAARSARTPARASRRRALPPGQLRALVLAHLTQHPSSDFSPGEIARVLGRSRGAVINACKRLTGLGLAIRTQPTPQRYQAAGQAQPDAAGSAPAKATG